MQQHPVIYLASKSPRRQELLRQIGVHFKTVPVDVDETPHAGEDAAAHAQRLALEKAGAGQASLGEEPDLPVLGADTIVVANGAILGKPRDRVQGIGMLRMLSGTTHQVLSAVAVAGRRTAVRLNTSSVTFRALSERECEAYWDTGEPADKAGAYAIQGLAALFVARLEGSYSGVMGLPLFETAELLQEAGVPLLQTASGS